MSLQGKVFVVDDEPDLRRALERLLRAEGLAVECFGSAADFLARPPGDEPACLLLDVAMPGLDGLALQQRLNDLDRPLPVVFLTGQGDIPMSVQAMKAGATDFLTKPAGRDALLRAIRAALERAGRERTEQAAREDARARVARLTPREREVLSHVVMGKLNKHIAAELGTTEQTVKVHRGRVMDKLGVRSVLDLARIAQLAGLPAPAP